MNTRPWFSLWSFPQQYKGHESPFIEENLVSCSMSFAMQFEGVKSEVLSYLSHHTTNPYFKKSMVAGGKGYHTLSLSWWGIQFYQNQAALPILSSLLKQHPEILTLSINILDSKGHILPHMGDTNAVYRGHFGIAVPDFLPMAGIRVKGEERSWKEGGFLWFMDAFEHETWNETNAQRIVLLVDVLRPEFKDQKNKICATVMTSLFLQKRIEKYPWMQRNQRGIVRFLAPFLIPLVALRIFWINKMRKY